MNRAASYCPAGGSGYVHCGRLGGYYDLKYYRTCDHLIGNTPDIVSYLVDKGWPKEKAHYLPNFVDGARSQAVPRKELYTPDEAAVVLALGRLHPNKGFDVLLHAIAKLPHVYLWLAGAGELADDLKSLASTLGVAPRIRFLGWRDDVPALFAASDVFVCSSRSEPLGNIIIEAWAQETPVVAAAAEGPRFLIQNQENGLLVELENADAMANAIYLALSDQDLAATIRAGGKKSFDAEYTEAAVVGRYLEFFQQVAL
jgi:glycosyltransferase involved in cell wall biosynthesis